MRRGILRAVRRVSVVDVFFRVIGLGLAATGLAHLAFTGLFARISAPVFPENTKAWVRVNGLSEAAIGAALAGRRTRLAGLIGGLVYLAHLADHVVAAVLRWVRSPDRGESVTHGESAAGKGGVR
ncbi:hypothetical protein GOHSU_30_00080 [Gordonia hirsuta DSM 44140 = NBRC 16056]|uniref:Uncharacterized protein n=1 Tax=Gordonia hirsuta DSM 44140 = NBRC 16056 TaxID=1121927 RepID=L7LB03_9ACTN|nr:hypothetical protein GOHSU_30_00080 [Gordonia hirsuta DSM 44140 = NBRC 16056]